MNKNLTQYIGKQGYISEDGWNFKKGSFTVTGVGEQPDTLTIDTKYQGNDGVFDANFIIARLYKGELK